MPLAPLSPMKDKNRPSRRSWRILLFSLPLPKSLFSAVPRDLVRFLIWKDRKGKTKVHKSACPLFVSHSKKRCHCVVRLAAGTVDSLIGKLRSLFNNVGRSGPWCDLLGQAILPPTSLLNITFVSCINSKLRPMFPSSSPFLFFVDKLWKLCHHLNDQAFVSCDTTLLNR